MYSQHQPALTEGCRAQIALAGVAAVATFLVLTVIFGGAPNTTALYVNTGLQPPALQVPSAAATNAFKPELVRQPLQPAPMVSMSSTRMPPLGNVDPMTEGAAASSVTPDFAAKGTALLTTALLSGMAFMAWTRRPLAGPESWIMAGTAGAEASKEEAAVPVKKPSKPRLPALDSIRFFLISYIVVGHFIQTCVTDATILKLFTQINVVVGAFFVLSGYVAGYTGTLIGKREADPRIEPTHKYVIGKIMGYYPLHLLVTLIFAPMFIYADSYYNGFFKAAAHGLMSLTLVQSWFPMHAEIWNAPTWFLSAMSFAMVAMPSSIASIAKMSKKGLTQALVCLSGILLIPRLAYSYDLGVWSIMEGLLNARTHPNIAFWNSIRFNPFYALLEMLIGVVLARMVMLDTEEDKAKAAKPGLLSSLKNSPVWPLVGMVAVIVLRAYDVVGLNDVLTRSLLFLPLFGRFLINAHRQTLRDTEGTPSLTRLLAWKPLTYLGTISFPIFVLHGPLGQLFYKKVIAKQFVWGAYNSQPWFFWLYLAATVVGGALLHWAFVSRKWVGNATRATMKSLCDRFA